MTRKELTDILRPMGVRNTKRMTLPQLEARYREITETQPEAPVSPEPPEHPNPDQPPPALYFAHAGWCEALHESYFMGYRRNLTWPEYYALLPYATTPPR